MHAETGAAVEAVQALKIETKTLRGDIRDMVLAEFKHIEKTWKMSNEEEQERLIDRASDIADKLVREAVDLIAARDLPALPITVGKIVLDGSECKGSFECFADDENLLRIRHLQGARAMFVLASPDAYAGEKAPAKPDVIGTLKVPEPDAAGILATMDADGHTVTADDDGIPEMLRRTA